MFFLPTDLLDLRHKISTEGLKPSLSNVETIVKMSTPHKNDELQCYLGIRNYLSRIICNYTKVIV